MNRRAVLSLAGIAAVLFSGLLLTNQGLADARSATPSASPVVSCTPVGFCESTGFRSRVWRSYEYVGRTFFRPQLMQFGIAEFDTPEHASAAMQSLLISCQTKPRAGQDASGVSLTSMDSRGDESLAVSGEVVDPINGNYFSACVVIRTGSYIRFCSTWSWASSPLDDALVVLDKTMQRMPSTSPVTTTLGISSGGLWGAIPALSDIPQGYHVLQESPAT